jgi:FO synthase
MNLGVHLEKFLEWRTLDFSVVTRHLKPSMALALEKVLETRHGQALSYEECLLLAECSDDDLLGLLVAADHVRRALVGDVISYVVTRNINFTNVCFVGCKFCAFSRGANHPEANFLSLEEIAHKAREAAGWGATEVCIQGGLPRGLPSFHYRDILCAVRAAVPAIHIHAFSPMEILYGRELTGMTLREYLLMLKEAGLNTMPGTAAEILDDEVRQVLSRNKLTTTQWKEIIMAAHGCGIPTTSTMMYGHIEEPRHWVNQLLLLRQMQSITGGFTEFVPLGFIHQNTLLFHQGLARPGATIEEHLKVHALARVLLAGAINNIQVSWVKLGHELSQLCLQAGANDYGGTLFEENISRLAGATAGQCLMPQEFQRRILELGRTPAERNTAYTKLTYPLAQPSEPISATLSASPRA